MEKIYIDLVQTSNFKFQVSFTNIIYFFLLQRYLTRSIIENSSKNIFWKEFFFYGKFNKYPDKRDYPIKGTIERIFHSRSEDSLKSIAKKVVPTLVPLGPILFRGIRERYRRIKKKKKTKTKIKKKQSIFGMEISGMHRENWCWHRQQRRRKASLQPLCDRSSLALFNHPFQSWRVFREIIPTFRDKIILSKEGKDSKHSFDSTLLFLLLMDTRLTFRAMP